MTTDQLINNVMRWGTIHKLDDPKAQLNKVIEEIGELAHEICRNNYSTPEARDAIGDVLVTVIILSQILGHDPMKCLAEAYEEISKRKGHTELGTFIKDNIQ